MLLTDWLQDRLYSGNWSQSHNTVIAISTKKA